MKTKEISTGTMAGKILNPDLQIVQETNLGQPDNTVGRQFSNDGEAFPEGPIALNLRPFARRVQRAIAFGVVVVPFIGFIVAIIQVWKYGVSVLNLVLLASMYVVTIFGETVGYHRHFAHRAFDTSKTMRVILAILGSMTAQGPIVFWVAVHRRHHAYSDREGDPHSPNIYKKKQQGLLSGLWHGHIGWMFTEEQTNWGKFARDIAQDRAVFRIHQQYFFWLGLGLVIPALLGGVITSSLAGAFGGFLWGGLVRIFLVNQAMWCVGSICHRFGRNPFRTHDYSGNVYWVALISFGEGLQNNHHAFPHAARHGLKWWEPDFSGWIISGMKALGLVWNVKHPTQQAILRSMHPDQAG